MIHAYLIEDVRALADLFKVNQAPKRSANGLFTAYRIRHPEFSARRALVLIGVQSSALKDELPASIGREIHAAVEEGQLYWYVDGDKQQLEVFDFDSSPHLSELLAPVKWREEIEHDMPVLFWLRDKTLMPEIVRRSLYLNNDRIQLATFTLEDEEVVMVRIEVPSYYLLAWCEEQDPERLTLYYPMTEGPGLYVQWRHEHPLADLWRRAWADHGEQWAFFPANGHRITIEKPEWRSIYDITDFSIEIEDVGVWEQVSKQVEHFEIALKLTPRHEPAPTEMLLLGEHERYKLEDFLSLTDDEDLDKLEISAQSDGEGSQWFFVREKHRSDGIMLVELGGRAYARYKGFDNLFLPVNLVLEPQLRRDQYKQLFGLDPSTLTFVVPRNEDVSQARQIKVKKSSFEPLSHFVDHVVHFDRAQLESILENSIFDLEVYKTAPSRPDMQRPGMERAGSTRSTKTKEKKDSSGNNNRLQAKLQAARKRQQRRASAAAEQGIVQPEGQNLQAQSTPSELELIEGELERDLIRQGPIIELWQDLLDIKLQRTKWLEASVCAIEGLWTSNYPDEFGSADPEEESIVHFKKGFAQAITKGKNEPAELAVVSALFSKTLEEGTDLSATIMEAAGQLRGIDNKLGKKVRWLAWREILSRTGDVRAQEEVRETLLTELNQRGLESLDTAVFLRERILKDPELEFDDDDLDDNNDTSYVLQNIEVIESSLESLHTTKIRHASRASLARVLAGMGIHARARDLINSALQGMEDSLGRAGQDQQEERSWPTRLMDFFRNRTTYGDSSRPERWHVWVALNAWLVFQRVEPSRADDARQAYEFLFNQLAPYEKEELKKTAESLEARVGQSNVAEFLAIDTRSFFSSRDLPDEMSKIVKGLQSAHKQRKDVQVNDLVERGIRLAMRELNESSHPSLETVARLILEMVEGLRRLKWEKEQRPVEQFEQFVKDLPLTPNSPDASRLYFAVLHCAAARALMDLGREKEAMARLVDIMRWVGEDFMQVLDFVDLVKKEVLLTVELAPRNQRTEALKWLMSTLREQERLEIGDDPTHPGAGFEMPFQAYELIQMIDHTLEAAISNEKLVLRRLRDFEEREEARIRYWVQRDQPAQA